MTCSDANKISIAGFLTSIGINPDKTAGNSFWYCSPLRNEQTPSFKVDRTKNFWYDFGTATGGSLIDLVCKMYHVEVPGALLILSGAIGFEPYFSSFDQPFTDQHLIQKPEPGLTVIQAQPLRHRALIQYLTSRRINLRFAADYIREVTYTMPAHDRHFFSVGFKNDSGGYELRNRFCKLSSSPKDITTIEEQNRSAVNIFEGFVDFLSALTYFKTDRAGCDTIVLNGVGLVKRIVEPLKHYQKINLYLDNDTAGKDAASFIQQLRPDAINRSQIIYHGYNDFNDFLSKKY
jgi:DNA primase